MTSKDLIMMLAHEAGITIGETGEPGYEECDIIVQNMEFYDKVFNDDSLGLGESYIMGWWDVGRSTLDDIFYRILKTDLSEKLRRLSFYAKTKLVIRRIHNYWFPVKTVEQSKLVALQHYDLGNTFYEQMLEPMVYSCGYFRNTFDTLFEAQMAKMELIRKKLKIEPGMRVLDIGCGWGVLAAYLSKNGAIVDAITISQQQYEYAKEKYADDFTRFYLADYREFKPDYQYDAIVSVGMFEHVNYNNYYQFMEIVNSLLKSDGLFLLHTIGTNISTTVCDPWINKYIFPNSSLPSLSQIAQSSEKFFVIEDVQNFGLDYDKTLMCWYHNYMQFYEKLRAGENIVTNFEITNEFHRMWTYYLLSCAGNFRARKIQLYQVVFSNKTEQKYNRPYY